MSSAHLAGRVAAAKQRLLGVVQELDDIAGELSQQQSPVSNGLQSAKDTVLNAGAALDAAVAAASVADAATAGTPASVRCRGPVTGWELLPDEVLCKIFFSEQLATESYPAIRAVCRSWKSSFDTSLQQLRLNSHPPAQPSKPLADLFPALTSINAAGIPRDVSFGWTKLKGTLQQLAQLSRLESLTLNKDCLAVAKSVLTNRHSAWAVVANRAPWHESGGERNIVMALPPQITTLSTLRSLRIVPSTTGDSSDWRNPYANEVRYCLPYVSCLAPLSALPTLSALHLASLLQHDELTSLVTLTSLRITHSPLQPSLLNNLTTLTALRCLELERIYTSPMGEPITPGLSALALLSRLCIRDSHLLDVPPVLSTLTALQYLDLTRNKLTALGPHLSPLPALRTLHLPLNALSPFPPQLARLPALAQVHLGSSLSRLNHLSSSPAFQAFCGITSLTKVSLAAVRLRTLPPSLLVARPLAILDLSGNHLAFLPAALSCLTALEVLQLPGNRISSLPHHLTSFTRLHTLDVTNNRNLTELHFPTSLTCLLAGRNSLLSLPRYITTCTPLACLDLSENPLASYPWHTLAPLTALTRLTLDNLKHSVLAAQPAAQISPTNPHQPFPPNPPTSLNSFVEEALDFLTGGSYCAAALQAGAPIDSDTAPAAVKAAAEAGAAALAALLAQQQQQQQLQGQAHAGEGGASGAGVTAGTSQAQGAPTSTAAGAASTSSGVPAGGSTAGTASGAGASSSARADPGPSTSTSGPGPSSSARPPLPPRASRKGKEPMPDPEPHAPPSTTTTTPQGATRTTPSLSPSSSRPPSASPSVSASPRTPATAPPVAAPPPFPAYARTIPPLFRRIFRNSPAHPTNPPTLPGPWSTHPFLPAAHPLLETLSLAGTRSPLLPAPQLATLTHLRSLNLSRTDLGDGQLVAALYSLVRLTHLDLSVNALNRLDPEVARLTALRQLDLSSNALQALPAELFGLRALRSLLLCANFLTALPDLPTPNNVLQLLDIRLNQLQGLPDSLTQLGALTDLLLDPPLDSLPPAIVVKLRGSRVTTNSHGPSRVRLSAQEEHPLNFFGLPSTHLTRIDHYHMHYWAAPPFLHPDIMAPAAMDVLANPLLPDDLMSDEGASDDSLAGMDDDDGEWVHMMDDDMPHLTDDTDIEDLG